MIRVKEIIKNILFILALIIIFNTIISYELAKSEYKTYSYVVVGGDTIWSIATNICSNNENLYIKNVIKDIREINNLDEPIIYIGQEIELPIYN